MIFNFFKKNPSKIIKENFDNNYRNLKSLSMFEQRKVLEKSLDYFHTIIDHKNDKQNLILISKQLTLNRQIAVSAGANSVTDLHWISIAIMEDLSQLLIVDEGGLDSNESLIKMYDWIKTVRSSQQIKINLRKVN